MANIKKNFNFRNGVQVDDDNLLVTATGLVGIGTTIPVESLDVRGNVIITGFTSATSANIGFLTVTTFEPTNIIGAGLSVKSGIVTATGTGILTYFGDASNLLGMPTSQWEDVDVGLGFTSIYNTGGNVGVGTEDPRTTIQVGGNVDAAQRGVGISSAGNINASGIITASTVVAGLSTNTNLFVTGISTLNGTVDINAPVNISSGLVVNTGATLDSAQVSDLTNDRVVIVGASGELEDDANLTFDGTTLTVGRDLDVDGHTNLDNLTVSGVTSFTSVIEAPAGMNKVPSLYMSQSDLPSATDYHGMFAHVHATGRGYFAHAMNWYELVNKDLFGVVGTGTEKYNLGITTISDLIVTNSATFSGTLNATTVESPNATVTSRLGVGSTVTPVSDIQIIKQDFGADADLQVSALNGISAVKVGREIGTAKTHTSEMRFGGGAGYPYSASGTALDIINHDTGNFNYYLSANNPSAVAGDFIWHKGANNARLMTLTGVGGSLGIGNTQPTKALDVTGAGNFSGDVNVGNNLIVNGLLLGNVQGTLTGNVSGTLAGNTNTTVGISTLNNLSVAGVATFSTGVESAAVGIGTTIAGQAFQMNDTAASRIMISSSGDIAIKKDYFLDEIDINACTSSASLLAIGVGVTFLSSAVDFSNAGVATARFMIPPKLSTSGRNSLQNLVTGAMIYNTSQQQMQYWNGSNWQAM